MIDTAEATLANLQREADALAVIPSDYDTRAGWHCTLGKAECEWAARGAIRMMQERGDRWQAIPVHSFHGFDRRKPFVLPYWWLERLQRVRVPRPGPPAPRLSALTRGCVQLVYPNGMVRAMGHDHEPEQVARVLERFDTLSI